MIHTKHVIFVVISFLVMGTLGLSYSTDAIAVPPAGRGGDCESRPSSPGITYYRCCWTETEEGDPEQIEIYMCQECTVVHGEVDCQNPFPDPSAAPTAGENIVPGDTGVLEQLQDDQPPLFGRNEAAVPPTGGIVQPFTTTTPPLFGNIPQGGGFGVLQEPETPPTFGQVAPLVQKPTTETPPTPLPTPTPPPPDFTPQDNQDDEGGGLPTIENQENVPPGGGVAEQPQDDGEQEDSSEGAETAGPLT
jgi:hypothetical protein